MLKYKLMAATAFVSPLAFAPTSTEVRAAHVASAAQAGLAQHTGITEDKDTGWIGKRHADSEAMLPYWTLVNDIVVGAQAVRDAGVKYLPKFPNETKEDYDYRLQQAQFTNIYRDIVEALASKPFEEEVRLIEGEGTKAKTIPEEISNFIEDVDGSGNNLTVFAADTFFKGINSAVDWIFVDYPKTEGQVITLAEQKRRGIKPHWSHVLAHNVLEIQSKIIDGKEQLTLVRIYEPGSPNKVRILRRDDTGATWELYREEMVNATKKYVKEDGGIISIGVIPMAPFVTGRRDGKRYFYYPAMRDAADLQIEVYQAETGLKYAKTLTSYPMLAGDGVSPEKDPSGNIKPIGMGPGRVLYGGFNTSKGSGGSWKFLEITGTSLKFLRDDIDAMKRDLRELGRQPLTAQSGNLTVITTAVAAGKARSAVANWSLGLKNTIENALVFTCMWMGISEETYSPEVSVYSEFDEFGDDKTIASLDAMRKNRDISRETYWREHQRRGTLSSEFDAEKEKQLLLDEMPGDEFEDEEDIDPATGKPREKPDPDQLSLPGVGDPET